MLLRSRAKDEFNIDPITSDAVLRKIEECVRIYQGHPDWVNEKDHIKTINFAKAICSEVARLCTLGIGIHVDGSARADYLQEQVDRLYFKLREWVEYGCAFGTVILKPDGSGVEMYTPDRFEITAQRNGKVTGAAFLNTAQGEDEKTWYTRLEYHRFLNGGVYAISNKCYEGSAPNDMRKRVGIEITPWADLREEVTISDLAAPLFAVLRTPHANEIEIGSVLSLSIFSDAIEELKDLDIAYSRNAKEIKDSKRIVMADDSLLAGGGYKVPQSVTAAQRMAQDMGLPDMIRMMHGSGAEEVYHEINPELNTETRVKGINSLLSQIGYKIGFANGYFVFNESSGIQTATGVEADQQRTIQLIKDVRDKLESCMDELLYAFSALADLYGLAPRGEYEAVYDFGDITYNREEDRARWYGYVVAGKIPFWYYLTKFEGMTEEDAKAMEAAAAPKAPTLFGSEE